MSTENNRLLLEIDRLIRQVNRDEINPLIPPLVLDDLQPVIRMAARARAAYLRELMDMSAVMSADAQPSPEQIAQLRTLRENYQELVSGTQALETAVQRGYLDVKERA